MELFTMYGEGAEINIYVHDPFPIEGDSENEYGTSGVEELCLTSLGDNVLDLGNEPLAEGAVDSHEEYRSDSDYVYGDSGSEGEGQNISCLDDSSDDGDESKVAKPVTEDIGVPHIDELEVTDSSDDQKSLADSDEDHKKFDEFTEFVEERDMKNPKLVCGMLFPNVRVFRALLKEYHIKEGYQYKYLNNERFTVQCIHNEKDMDGLGSPCTFRLHA